MIDIFLNNPDPWILNWIGGTPLAERVSGAICEARVLKMIDRG